MNQQDIQMLLTIQYKIEEFEFECYLQPNLILTVFSYCLLQQIECWDNNNRILPWHLSQHLPDTVADN